MCEDKNRIKLDMESKLLEQLRSKELGAGSQYVLHELNEYQLRQVLSFVRSFY